MSKMFGNFVAENIHETKKIEDYVQDSNERFLYYPNVKKVQIVEQKYEDSTDEIIVKVERQIKKYNVRPQVRNLLEKSKGNVESNEKVIYMEQERNEEDIGQGYVSIYVPSFEKYEEISTKKEKKMEMYEIDKKKVEEVSKEPETYRPPNVKSNESVSIVVKEIPNYMTVFEAKKVLREIFSEHGMILNINVLCKKDSSGERSSLSNGIAFIDFASKEDVERLLGYTGSFRISNSILKLELANSSRN